MATQRQLDGFSIEVVEGDITELAADAITNAANDHLWMGGGVAGAIKRKGGKEIEQEAVAKGPIAIGEAIATGAGALSARYVIHAAVMGQDLKTNADYIRKATLATLRVADRELGVESLGLVAFGTGVGGFPLEEAARIMLSAVREQVGKLTSLKRIIFCLFSQPAYQAFAEALEKL